MQRRYCDSIATVRICGFYGWLDVFNCKSPFTKKTAPKVSSEPRSFRYLSRSIIDVVVEGFDLAFGERKEAAQEEPCDKADCGED